LCPKKSNIEGFFFKLVHSCLKSCKSYNFNIKFIFNFHFKLLNLRAYKKKTPYNLCPKYK